MHHYQSSINIISFDLRHSINSNEGSAHAIASYTLVHTLTKHLYIFVNVTTCMARALGMAVAIYFNMIKLKLRSQIVSRGQTSFSRRGPYRLQYTTV